MTEWNEINPELNEKLQWEWYNKGFTAEQTKKWIDTGLEPADYSLASYLRDKLNLNAEYVAKFSDVVSLKTIYQESLEKGNSGQEQGLEKYLSENRLQLKKYFPFNLNELTTEKTRLDGMEEGFPNGRIVKKSLADDLTTLARSHNWNLDKNGIILTTSNGQAATEEWSGNKLDQKINKNTHYIIFDKDQGALYSGFVPVGEGYRESSLVYVVVSPFGSKSEVLKFLKEYDPLFCQAVSCPEKVLPYRDYCDYHRTCLTKLRAEESIPDIQEIDTFQTWFNGNCGTLINKDNSNEYPFRFWVVIYEPQKGSAGEYWATINLWNFKNLTRAQWEARLTKNKLRENNVLVNPFTIHWKADKHTSLNNLVCEPQVRRIDLPWKEEDTIILVPVPPTMMKIPAKVKTKVPCKTPENYLKPLDMVWVRKMAFPGVSYWHVGVYLGDNRVCHFSSESKSRASNRTIITDWDEFIKGYDPQSGKVFAYHPILPFKHYELIAKQIDWAWENDYDEGRYCLPNNNCEHHANSFVFGIDYSMQIWNERGRTFWGWKDCKFCNGCEWKTINNRKGSTVKLTEEIKETNKELGTNDGVLHDEIKYQYEAKTVVPPKDCQIM